MEKSKNPISLVRSAGILLVGQSITQILAFPIGILIARSTNPVNYGQYAVAVALVGSFAGLYLMGVDAITSRESARYPNSAAQILVNISIPTAIWILGVIAVIEFSARVLSYSTEVRSLLWFVAGETAVISLLNLVRSSFRGVERMEWDTITRIIESILAVTAVALIVFFHGSILTIALSLVIARGITFIAMKPFLGHLVKEPFSIDTGLVRKMIFAAIPIGVAGLISSLYLRLDAVLLGVLRSEHDVGFYNIAYNLSFTWLPISISLTRSMAPQLSSLYYKNDHNNFNVLLQKGLRYSLIVGLPAGLVTALLSKQIITLLYGPIYLNASPALTLLGSLIPIIFINTLFLNVLVAVNKQNLLIPIMITSLAVMLGFTAFLVPRWGLIGTSLSVVFRETIALFLYTYFVFKTLKNTSWTIPKDLLLSIFLSAAALVVCILLLKAIVNIWGILMISGSIYFFVLILTGGIRVSVFKFFSNVLSR